MHNGNSEYERKLIWSLSLKRDWPTLLFPQVVAGQFKSWSEKGQCTQWVKISLPSQNPFLMRSNLTFMHLYFHQISMNMKLFTIKLKSGQFKLAFTYIVIGFFHHETIQRLRQHNCGLFLTRPLCQHKFITKRQQNRPFYRPTHSVFADVIYEWSQMKHLTNSRHTFDSVPAPT